jgi:hypothetical protein
MARVAQEFQVEHAVNFILARPIAKLVMVWRILDHLLTGGDMRVNHTVVYLRDGGDVISFGLDSALDIVEALSAAEVVEGLLAIHALWISDFL